MSITEASTSVKQKLVKRFTLSASMKGDKSDWEECDQKGLGQNHKER